MTDDMRQHAPDTDAHPPGALPSAGRVRVTYPDSESVVLSVGGQLDAAGLPRLHQVLWPRVMAAVGTLVVDLTAVEFLGIAGLDLLNQARLQATERGLALRLVVSGHEVCHAVHVAGLAPWCRASLAEALTEASSTEQTQRGGA
jgi:anti-anti-sigma factor